jgi:hypothetical protein
MDALVIVLLALTVWRATRFVVKDDLPLVKTPRDRLVRRSTRSDGTLRWYGELITCPWCTSVWLAGVGTALTWWLRDDGLPVPLLVFGAVAAFAATYEDLTTRAPAPTTTESIAAALDDPLWQQFALSRIRDGQGGTS